MVSLPNKKDNTKKIVADAYLVPNSANKNANTCLGCRCNLKVSKFINREKKAYLYMNLYLITSIF